MNAGGLSQVEAESLLKIHGANALSAPARLQWLRRLGELLAEPTLLVLLAVLLLYMAMGSRGEALLLGIFVLIVIAVTYVEQARTEGALKALAGLSSPRALALRDGAWKRVSGLTLVPGDLLNMGEGDRVAADAEIVEAHDFMVDESFLTGESRSVWKNLQAGAPSEERQVFAGSLVTQGQALARVTATGLKTRAGAVARSMAAIKAGDTPFQASIHALVRVLAQVAAVACLGVVGISLYRGVAWVPSILRGLTLAVAAVPEELPVILAIFLAMGARRLSAKGVLARHVQAVETLGAVTLLAVDKTGTLTRNEMRLSAVIPAAGHDEDQLLRAAAEACEIEPFDPMERRILERAGRAKGTLTHEYSLFGRPPRMGHVWDGSRVAAKGSVEGMLEHCTVSSAEAGEHLASARGLALRGLRVIAVAEGFLQGPPPAELPRGLRYLGLLGFEDPLREGVPEAIAVAHAAGIRVVMLTGDSAETAGAIAAQLGMAGKPVLLGSDLEQQPQKVAEMAAQSDVFARMAPEHKLILIQAWSQAGEVVGMTGDGVNDGPALIQAHVGIAMGERGTDVAREAADMVLSDDSFESLVEGVRIGRSTTRRILKAALFVLAVHVPIIGVVLGCLIFDLPPLIEAAQIAFLELFIGPSCSIVFERVIEGGDLMALKPRDPKAPLLSWRSAAYALFQGAVILFMVFGLYAWGLKSGRSAPEARSFAFVTLMFADFMLCWTLLSQEPFWKALRWTNGAFWAVSASVLGLLALLMSWAPVAGIFHMALPGPATLAACFGFAALSVLWNEALKAGPWSRTLRDRNKTKAASPAA